MENKKMTELNEMYKKGFEEGRKFEREHKEQYKCYKVYLNEKEFEFATYREAVRYCLAMGIKNAIYVEYYNPQMRVRLNAAGE